MGPAEKNVLFETCWEDKGLLLDIADFELASCTSFVVDVSIKLGKLAQYGVQQGRLPRANFTYYRIYAFLKVVADFNGRVQASLPIALVLFE